MKTSTATLEALIVAIIGMIGFFASIKLFHDLRLYSSSKVGGGEIYLSVISLIILISGITLLVKTRRQPLQVGFNRILVSGKGAMLAISLTFYVVMLEILGYLIASIMFFPVAFYFAGLQNWYKSFLWGIFTAGIYYVLFSIVLDVVMPKGIFGLW